MAPASSQPCATPVSSSGHPNPLVLPSILNLLLNDDFHYLTLAVFLLVLIARFLVSFLPRYRLLLLEHALEGLNDILFAAQENSLDRQFILDARLAFEILKLDVSELRRKTVHITSTWQDICAFCKGFSTSISECNKSAIHLEMRIKVKTEQDKQLAIKAEINNLKMLSTFLNESDVIAKPLPCVFAATSNLHGRPTIRATGTFQPSGKLTRIVDSKVHNAKKEYT